MVDLVKIRKKAKEKKDPDAQAEETRPDETPVADASPEAKEADKNAPEAASVPDKPPEKTPAKPKADDKKGSAKKADDAAAPSRKPVQPAAKKVSAESPAAKEAPKAKPAPPPPDESDDVLPEPEDLAGPEIDEEPDESTLDRLARFKREAGKRRSWGAASVKAGPTEAEVEADRGLELLRFRLAGEEYAVDIEKIVEIVPPRGTTRVPNADGSIVGIMSLRGTIVTVFDLRKRLGHPPIEEGRGVDRRLIVVEREGETAGFLVDKVSRVVKLDPSELESHPVVSAAEQSDYVGGVFQAADGLVILLDLEKILASQS